MVVYVRWLIKRDYPEVLEIEKACFDYPWDQDDFQNCLRTRNTIGMVAEYNERVIGYIVFESYKHKFRVVNLAVHPDFRRKKIGRGLVEKVFGKLSRKRRSRVITEVRESNLAAQLFFRSIGFAAIEILRDFEKDTGEDSYLFEYWYFAEAELIAG